MYGFNIGLAWAVIRAYDGAMQTVPISKVKDKLNEYVDSVAITHDQVTITKNGSPAAVLIGADEWESIQETLFWLSQPGIRDTIAEAEGRHRGRTYPRRGRDPGRVRRAQAGQLSQQRGL